MIEWLTENNTMVICPIEVMAHPNVAINLLAEEMMRFIPEQTDVFELAEKLVERYWEL